MTWGLLGEPSSPRPARSLTARRPEAWTRFCPWCYCDGSDITCSIQAHWPEVRRHNPLYLSGVECTATRGIEAAGLGVGLMLQLGSGLAGRADYYRWWAADNGCFCQGAAFDDEAWFAWLASLPTWAGTEAVCSQSPPTSSETPKAPGTQLAVVPLVRAPGIPVAPVAQNGADAHLAM